MIKYSSYNDFSVFCKKFNFEPETISEINPSHPVRLSCYVLLFNVQLIYLGVNGK